MKIEKNISFILGFGFILFYLVACSNNNKKIEINQSEKQEELFLKYISKFKKIDLPFFFRGWDKPTLYVNELTLLNKNSVDTIFYPIEYRQNVILVYGKISQPSKFTTIIYFIQTEDIFPLIVTYSKSGKIIDSKRLIIKGCGSDCGLKYCCYTTTIDKDLNILLADTMLYNQKCFDEYMTDSTLNYYYSKKGKISKDGKISI